jgi:hypothetical protein
MAKNIPGKGTQQVWTDTGLKTKPRAGDEPKKGSRKSPFMKPNYIPTGGDKPRSA